MLCIKSTGPNLFYNSTFVYFLISFPFCSLLQPTFPSGKGQSVLYESGFYFLDLLGFIH